MTEKSEIQEIECETLPKNIKIMLISAKKQEMLTGTYLNTD